MATTGSSRFGLRRIVHAVGGLGFADQTGFEGGVLSVSAAEMEALLADPVLATVGVSLLSPGDPARIVKVLDAVEPRCKGKPASQPGAGPPKAHAKAPAKAPANGGPGGAYPGGSAKSLGGGIFSGFLGPARVQGRGDTHVLRGAAVVAAGYLPRAQEALVDMSGPGAALSPLGLTHNVVVTFSPAEDAPWEEVDAAVRRGTLRVAARLAAAALAAEPDAVEELGAPAAVPAANGSAGLPRVGAITNLQTQGAFKDVFFYGRSLAGSPPVLIDPCEIEDGAVVSGQYGHPALRNPTYVHQNHPVVAALRAADGDSLSFGGLILSPEPVEQGAKELTAAHAARLCAALGWDAAIITKEGGGNADSDVSLKMDALEEVGVVGVGLFAEMSGADGSGAPLVSPPVKATAMISTGNYDERVRLPAVRRAVGGERFDLLGVEAGAEIEVPTAVIVAALSPLGWGRLSAAGPAVTLP